MDNQDTRTTKGTIPLSLDKWPRAGLKWTRALGEIKRKPPAIDPMAGDPNRVQQVNDAITEAMERIHGPQHPVRRAHVDYLFYDLMRHATENCHIILEESLINFIATIRDSCDWCREGDLSTTNVMVLFMELLEARNKYLARPASPFDMDRHSWCAQEVDIFNWTMMWYMHLAQVQHWVEYSYEAVRNLGMEARMGVDRVVYGLGGLSFQ